MFQNVISSFDLLQNNGLNNKMLILRLVFIVESIESKAPVGDSFQNTKEWNPG